MEVSSHLREPAAAVGSTIQRHLLTLITGVLGFCTLFWIPQVHNLLFELPSAIKDGEFEVRLAWFGFLTVAIFFDVNLLKLIDPVRDSFKGPIRTLSRSPVLAGWIVSGGFVLIAFTLFFLTADPSHGSHRHGLVNAARLYLPILLLVAAAICAPIRHHLSKVPFPGGARKRETLLRLFVAVAGLYFAGWAVWGLADNVSWITYRTYSIWALLQLVFMLVAVGRALDVLSSSGFALARPLALGVALLLPFSWKPTAIGTPAASATPQTAVGATPSHETEDSRPAASLATRWFDAIDRKLDSLPPNGPAVVVAASGGGSRAALFSALVFESLRRTEIEGASLADRILLISSVSGGSLASSYFATQTDLRKRTGSGGPYSWQHSRAEDQHKRVRQEAPALVARAADASLSNAFQELADSPAPLPDWVLQSRFVDEMNTDFIAPILVGILDPRQRRGQSLSRFWEREFEWSEFSTSSDIRLGPDLPPPPLLILNATAVEFGTRLAIGFPPLPPGLLASRNAHLDKSERPTSLSDHGAYEISLADAVRLSASFPWSVPVGRLTLESARHILDGGVLDVTGLDTLTGVLAGLDAWSKEDGGDPLDLELQRRASSITEKLQARGIVVVVIDSGAQPSSKGEPAGRLGEVINPVHALRRSAFLRAAEDKQAHLDDLEKLDFVSWLESFRCGDDRIITSWALGPQDKARVFVRFLGQEPKKRDGFLEKIEAHRQAQRRDELQELIQKTAQLDQAFRRAFVQIDPKVLDLEQPLIPIQPLPEIP